MNEHQNAYALSCATHDYGRPQVQALLDQGLHVVVARGPAHCRFTDAVLPGDQLAVISAHMCRRIAEHRAARVADKWAADECSWEGDVVVMPLPPEPAPAPRAWPVGDDDIPF